MRYFLELSYLGTNYHGWQRQPNCLSVQEVLEQALSVLLKETVAVTGAGRTDTGVHALCMVTHVDTDVAIATADFRYKLNAILPHDIAIQALYPVRAEAHARYHAHARTYEYWLHRHKNPFLADYSYYFQRELDVPKMNEAAQWLLHYSDFECFSKSHSGVKNHFCHISRAGWEACPDGYGGEKLVFTITANRFLRNMVRAIVGTLLEVGTLKRTIEDFKKLVESKQRSRAGVSVPAQGLYLAKVVYPSTIFTDTMDAV